MFMLGDSDRAVCDSIQDASYERMHSSFVQQCSGAGERDFWDVPCNDLCGDSVHWSRAGWSKLGSTDTAKVCKVCDTILNAICGNCHLQAARVADNGQ